MEHADFSLSGERTNSYQQGSGAGSYTVRAGDTLGGIAAMLWGDSALWYKLAEANGLGATSALNEGQVLRIPASVQKNTHNASTFRPYDPSQILGETSPTTPQPAKNNKCGAFGAILLVVIAVAVTIATGGAAIAALTPNMGWIGGMGAFATASAGAAVGGTAGLIGIGAAAGAVGSAVSQGIGVATGLQDKFSWKNVAMAGISGGVGAGLGGVGAFNGIGGLGKLGNAVAQGALRAAPASAITQGIGVATRMQDKFDFAGVAIAGVVGGATAAAGSLLKVQPLADNNTLRNHLAHGAAGMAGAIAGAAARSVVSGTSFGDNIMAVLPDVVGATVGNMLAHGVSAKPTLSIDWSFLDSYDRPSGGTIGEQLVPDPTPLNLQVPTLPPRSDELALPAGAQPMDALPDGTTMSVRTNTDGTWDMSTLAYHVVGKEQPQYINQDFGDPTSVESFKAKVRGGLLDGEVVDAQQSSSPQVYRSAGVAYVYTEVAGTGVLRPLRVREISGIEMTIRRDLSLVADFVPVLGAAKAAGQAISGRDSYTGQRVDRTEQAIVAGAAVLGAAIGRTAAGAGTKIADKASPAATRSATWFDDIALSATRNPQSSRVVLGHYASKGVSYQKVASHYNATYFKLDNFSSVTKGMSQDEIWRINETFLSQQLKQGKQVLLSHDPKRARVGSFFEREVTYLKDLGYTFRQKNRWTWEAVR